MKRFLTRTGKQIITVTSTSVALLASSHREAPLITETPKVDGTDFYMFNSYEPAARIT